MQVIEEHPSDLSEPYDKVEKELEWIHEDAYLHIFEHHDYPSSVFIWFPHGGEGIQMDEKQWLEFELTFDI